MNTAERKHVAAWLVVPLFAVANGAVRDLTYGRSMSPTASHSLSVVPLIAAILIFAVVVERRWPLHDRRAAARIGALWLTLTLLFEVGLDALMRVPFKEMITAYDVTRGHLWPLVPLAMGLAPEFARRWQGWRARMRTQPRVA